MGLLSEEIPMPTVIHRRVEQARQKSLPSVVGRTRSGWIVMGDRQVVRGYCLLLPDPVVGTLNDLQGAAREQFLSDMVAAGDALLAVTRAARINYEILGNLEPALHAHLFPRYTDEPAELRARPIWFYDWNHAPAFDPVEHRDLMEKLREAMRQGGVVVG